MALRDGPLPERYLDPGRRPVLELVPILPTITKIFIAYPLRLANMVISGAGHVVGFRTKSAEGNPIWRFNALKTWGERLGIKKRVSQATTAGETASSQPGRQGVIGKTRAKLGVLFGKMGTAIASRSEKIGKGIKNGSIGTGQKLRQGAKATPGFIGQIPTRYSDKADKAQARADRKTNETVALLNKCVAPVLGPDGALLKGEREQSPLLSYVHKHGLENINTLEQKANTIVEKTSASLVEIANAPSRAMVSLAEKVKQSTIATFFDDPSKQLGFG